MLYLLYFKHVSGSDRGVYSHGHVIIFVADLKVECI